MVSVMTQSRTVSAGERIIEPMIALAGCSTSRRILVAGSRSVELMLELHRRGYLRASAWANCGHPAGQYDATLVDWRQRTLKALERTLDWLVDYLAPAGVLVLWVDPHKPAAYQDSGPPWNGAVSSSRPQPSVTTARPSRRGDTR